MVSLIRLAVHAAFALVLIASLSVSMESTSAPGETQDVMERLYEKLTSKKGWELPILHFDPSQDSNKPPALGLDAAESLPRDLHPTITYDVAKTILDEMNSKLLQAKERGVLALQGKSEEDFLLQWIRPAFHIESNDKFIQNKYKFPWIWGTHRLYDVPGSQMREIVSNPIGTGMFDGKLYYIHGVLARTPYQPQRFCSYTRLGFVRSRHPMFSGSAPHVRAFDRMIDKGILRDGLLKEKRPAH